MKNNRAMEDRRNKSVEDRRRYVIISGVWLGIVNKNYIDIDSVPDLSGYARHFARESEALMRIWCIAFRYYAPHVDTPWDLRKISEGGIWVSGKNEKDETTYLVEI